jgi:hypothetical protein
MFRSHFDCHKIDPHMQLGDQVPEKPQGVDAAHVVDRVHRVVDLA